MQLTSAEVKRLTSLMTLVEKKQGNASKHNLIVTDKLKLLLSLTIKLA